MSRPVLADAFAHHTWATDKILEVCAALDAEALDTNVPGTYGSIIDTLRHTVGADASYLALLSGDEALRIEEESLDLSALRTVNRNLGPVWQRVVAEDIDPDRVVVRTRDDGSTSSAPLGVRLAQVVHHGTDHRSQVCTALSTLGVEPPEIDVWAWAWGKGTLSETPPTK
jgi:uncharacterized damage-inducible protein DinB